MRILTLAIGALCVLASSAGLEAGDRLFRVGTVKIDCSGPRGSFILDDGNIYKPISSHQRDKTKDWQLGDNILILATEHSNRFVLVNVRTNQKAKVKAISISSSSL